MKKVLMYASMLAMAVAFTSCSRDEGMSEKKKEEIEKKEPEKKEPEKKQEPTLIKGTTLPTADTGKENDFYWNSDTRDLYGPKTAEGWGEVKQKLSGTGDLLSGLKAPSILEGSDGDWYLDVKAQKLYGPKRVLEWGEGKTPSTDAGSGGSEEGDDDEGGSEGTATAEKYTLSKDKMTLISWNNEDETSVDMTEGELANVQVIGEEAFSKVKNLTSIKLPTELTEIGTMAFYDTQLSSIELPSTLTTIGASAFLNNSLTTVTIPDSVTEIGMSAFNGNSITNVVIGTGIKKIGHSAFIGNSLKSVTINAVTPPELEANAFGLPFAVRSLKIFVPAEKVEEYKKAWEKWKAYVNKIEAKQDN